MEWELTFSDEFDEGRLDRTKWNPFDPWQVERNGELQAYVPNNFQFGEETIKIVLEERKAFYDGKVRDYASGILTTRGKFSQRFGRFGIRCRVPEGKGLWPAFWLLPEPLDWPPEIDVFEILGQEPDRVYLTHHWRNPKDPGGDSLSEEGEWKGPDFSAEFHEFTVEWEPGEIRWYVDGVERFRANQQVPDQPMFVLLNLAIGGGWAGEPDDSTRFPAALEVDWVRVWERTPENQSRSSAGR